jgi:hypothetical protein
MLQVVINFWVFSDVCTGFHPNQKPGSVKIWRVRWDVLRAVYCCRSERALSERARQQTKIVQLLKISILLKPQSMLVESHFTNMQRAAI